MKAILFITLLFAFGHLRHVYGSCLSYGHSCWGAHGKRSGDVTNTQLFHPRNLRQMSLAERFALMKLNSAAYESGNNDEGDPIQSNSVDSEQLDNTSHQDDKTANSVLRGTDLDFLEPTQAAAHLLNEKSFIVKDKLDESKKQEIKDKIEANTINFLNAVDSLPGIEDFLFVKNEDGSDHRHIRHLKPGPHRFHSQSIR